MSFSVVGTEDGPEVEAMEIPGFPKPHNPGGFTGNLQVGTSCIGSGCTATCAFEHESSMYGTAVVWTLEALLRVLCVRAVHVTLHAREGDML